MESPTPWHVGGIGGCRPKLVYDASGRTILRSWGNGSDEENEANVQLAAKAPKLREQVSILREELGRFLELHACNDQRDYLAAFDAKHKIPKAPCYRYGFLISSAKAAMEATKEGT